jgi:gamma-glutamyltranspeptidase/glutathione hydrolase
VPRYHHQYLPDEIQHEPDALSEDVIMMLKNKGHQLKSLGRTYGNMHVVMWDKKTNKVHAASDLRVFGQAMVETKP